MRWRPVNAGLKLASLALAILTWFLVRHATSERRVVEDVPVEVRLRPGLTVAEGAVPTVNVMISGTHGDIWQVSRAELVPVLDLRREERPSRVTARLTPAQVRHPTRVQVVQVVPAQIAVRLTETRSVDTTPRAGVEHRP